MYLSHSDTFRNNTFIKLSSAGNVLFLQGASSSRSKCRRSAIGAGNLLTSLDLLRLSGEKGLITTSPTFLRSSIGGITLDDLRVVTAAVRSGSELPNALLFLNGATESAVVKNIALRNMVLQSGFSGTTAGGAGWRFSLSNVTVGGVPLREETYKIGIAMGGGSSISFK